MRLRGFFSGMFIGLIVGAVVGLLYAPQSGEETREAINSQTRDLSGKLMENSRHLMESGRDLIEKGKAQVSSTVHNRLAKVGASISNGKEGKNEA